LKRIRRRAGARPAEAQCDDIAFSSAKSFYQVFDTAADMSAAAWLPPLHHQTLSRVTERYRKREQAILCISYYKVEICLKRWFVILRRMQSATQTHTLAK
jgi:hypothetical protein